VAAGAAGRVTSSVAAYRAYIEGVRALNAWRLERADSLFGAAIAADSTFALAYYKRALTYGWRYAGNPEQGARVEQLMALATRHAGRLPAREQALIGAYRELTRGFARDDAPSGRARARAQLAEAERRYATIVAGDPAATEAWYGLGDARFHGAQLERDLNVKLAGMNGALRAFARTIALDPSFHLAYSHRLELYADAARAGNPVLLDGDTLALVQSEAARAAFGPARAAEAKARAQQLVVRDAQAWVDADPGAAPAYETLARAYAVVGQTDSSVLTMERAMAHPEARRLEMGLCDPPVPARRRRPGGGAPGAAPRPRAGPGRLAPRRAEPAALLVAPGGQRRRGGRRVAGRRAAGGRGRRGRPAGVPAAGHRAGRLPHRPAGALVPRRAGAGHGAPADAARRAVLARGTAFVGAIPGTIGEEGRAMSVGVPYVAYLVTGEARYRDAALAWADSTHFTALAELDALAALAAGDRRAPARSPQPSR
jgi:hypothetical protein